jgi:hypothetical protein
MKYEQFFESHMKSPIEVSVFGLDLRTREKEYEFSFRAPTFKDAFDRLDRLGLDVYNIVIKDDSMRADYAKG